jgi:hypothetical protein
MSGATWIQRAMQTADPATADRCLLEALRLEPDLGQAYGMRGRLAVLRGDAVAAAHHFRVAYARGDRTPETRVGLALCLAAAGQLELAARIREDLAVPASLADFEDTCELQVRPLRQVLAIPLPGRGEAALLPGERLPAQTEAEPASASAPGPSIRATAEQSALPAPTVSASGFRVLRSPGAPGEPSPMQTMPRFSIERRPTEPSNPPAPAPAPAPSAQTPPAPPPPPPPIAAVSTPPRAVPATPPPAPVLTTRRLPDWVDQIDRSEIELPPLPEEKPDWISTNVEAPIAADIRGAIDLIDDDEDLVVTNDPGAPAFGFRSPVTGRIVRPDEVAKARADALMPSMERAPDLLGRAPVFADLIDTRRLLLALELPGPVLTMAGAPPRPLCRTMAFGATPDELFFRDIEREGVPPVRLNRTSIARMDVVNDDQQVSFVLADGRQLHLDLRGLARTHGPTVRQLVRRLRELIPEAR